MAKPKKSANTRPANRFYRSAKVSEYQLKRVLWSFVRDEAVAEAATHIDFSTNSINAIYAKLREFFTALGVFDDIYNGGDPRDGMDGGEELEEFERRLIGFHLERVSDKRRMKDTQISEVDYNWCESHWRFHYSVMAEGRASGAVERMMFSHLFAHLRLSGPIGQTPKNRNESLRLKTQQMNQRILWMERNALAFRYEVSRADLRNVLNF